MCDDDWSKQENIVNVNPSVIMVGEREYQIFIFPAVLDTGGGGGGVKASIIQLVRTQHYLPGARVARAGGTGGGREGVKISATDLN